VRAPHSSEEHPTRTSEEQEKLTKISIVESARTQLIQAARETALLNNESNNQPHAPNRSHQPWPPPTNTRATAITTTKATIAIATTTTK
jgi:hypothetical protein